MWSIRVDEFFASRGNWLCSQSHIRLSLQTEYLERYVQGKSRNRFSYQSQEIVKAIEKDLDRAIHCRVGQR